jgi:hypothetical protein
MFCFYVAEWTTEEELLAHLEQLKQETKKPDQKTINSS